MESTFTLKEPFLNVSRFGGPEAITRTLSFRVTEKRAKMVATTYDARPSVRCATPACSGQPGANAGWFSGSTWRCFRFNRLKGRNRPDVIDMPQGTVISPGHI